MMDSSTTLLHLRIPSPDALFKKLRQKDRTRIGRSEFYRVYHEMFAKLCENATKQDQDTLVTLSYLGHTTQGEALFYGTVEGLKDPGTPEVLFEMVLSVLEGEIILNPPMKYHNLRENRNRNARVWAKIRPTGWTRTSRGTYECYR